MMENEEMEQEFDFTQLSPDMQEEYTNVAEQIFGKPDMCCETGEPLYLDDDGNMNFIYQVVFDRIQVNKSVN